MISLSYLETGDVQVMIAMWCAHIAMSQKTNNQTANLKSSDKGLTTKLPKVILNTICNFVYFGWLVSKFLRGNNVEVYIIIIKAK